MFVNVLFFVSFQAGTHAYLNKQDAQKITNWFKPQIVGEDILSTIGVKEYTKAKILLETECTGAILQYSHENKINLFCIKSNNLSTTIVACLWSPNAPKSHCFQALVQYHDYFFNDSILYASGLEECDQKQWNEIIEY